MPHTKTPGTRNKIKFVLLWIVSYIGVSLFSLMPSAATSLVASVNSTEYKFTYVRVCVSITLSVNSPTGQTPQRIFTADSLKDADLRKDVPFGGLDDE